MRRLLSCCLFVALAGCDDPFFVEAKAVSVCQHLTHQRFGIPSDVRAQVEALPAGMRAGLEVSRVFDFDVAAKLPADLQAMLDSRVKLTSITITSSSGEGDLGFVDEAHVTLQPAPESGLETRQFDYVKSEAAPRRVSWSGEAFDVAAYLESGNLRYLVSLVGAVPEGDIVVDIEACAEAAVTLDYL